MHNLVVAGRTDAAADTADQVARAAEDSTSAEARFAVELAHGGLDYQQFRFAFALDTTRAAAAQIGTSEDVRARLAQYFRCWPLVALDRFDDATAVRRWHRVPPSAIGRTGRCTSSKPGRGCRLCRPVDWPMRRSPSKADSAVGDAHLVVGIIDAADVAGLGRLKIHLGDERGAREVAQICQVMLEATAPGVPRGTRPGISPRTRWRWANPHGCASMVVRSLGDTERLSIFPLFPHDIANDPELMRIALAVGDDELVEHLVATAEQRGTAQPARAIVQAACAAHVRGLATTPRPT